MDIKTGFRNNKEMPKHLETISSTYTIKNEKEINYGLQFKVYYDENCIRGENII